MKTATRRTTLLATALIMLSPLATNAAVVHHANETLQAMVASGAEVTVPAGDTHRLVLPDGSRVMVAEGSTYQLASVDGEIRVMLVSGTASILVAEGGRVTQVVDGQVIVAEDGAEMVVSIDSSGTKIAHANKKGSLSINGAPVAVGTGGVIADDGSFTENPAEAASLMSSHGGLIKDSGLPVPERALKKMPKHAREIVEENVSDISPS